MSYSTCESHGWLIVRRVLPLTNLHPVETQIDMYSRVVAIPRSPHTESVPTTRGEQRQCPLVSVEGRIVYLLQAICGSSDRSFDSVALPSMEARILCNTNTERFTTTEPCSTTNISPLTGDTSSGQKPHPRDEIAGSAWSSLIASKEQSLLAGLHSTTGTDVYMGSWLRLDIKQCRCKQKCTDNAWRFFLHHDPEPRFTTLKSHDLGNLFEGAVVFPCPPPSDLLIENLWRF